jgi:small subunit ribosomal protein S18
LPLMEIGDCRGRKVGEQEQDTCAARRGDAARRPLTAAARLATVMVSVEIPYHSVWKRDSTTMVRKKLGRGRKNRCRFCTKDGCPRPAFVDYKDVQTLKKLCTSQGKLFSRKRSGNCAAFQRAVKDAIKRARFMALMPYVGE